MLIKESSAQSPLADEYQTVSPKNDAYNNSQRTSVSTDKHSPRSPTRDSAPLTGFPTPFGFYGMQGIQGMQGMQNSMGWPPMMYPGNPMPQPYWPPMMMMPHPSQMTSQMTSQMQPMMMPSPMQQQTPMNPSSYMKLQ